MITKIKKGDTVKLLSGKDRGKTGKVLQMMLSDGRVVVEGINVQKKNVRAKKQGEKGQVVEYNSPIDISNLMVVCPKCNKPSRLGGKKVGNDKLRVCKKCKAEF